MIISEPWLSIRSKEVIQLQGPKFPLYLFSFLDEELILGYSQEIETLDSCFLKSLDLKNVHKLISAHLSILNQDLIQRNIRNHCLNFKFLPRRH